MVRLLWGRINLLVGMLNHQRFTGLFALALSFAILFGATDSIHSQSAPSQDALRQEIRELAAQDVENEIPRRHPFAIDRFKENSVGIKAPEIAKIYDDEYTKQDKAKKRDPREIFNPKNGWIVAILSTVALTVVAFFGDQLKQGVTKAWKAIDSWIYGRFAGSPLFREVALRRYREALIHKFGKLQIPFRGNRDPLDMGEVYVPLKVEGSAGNDQVDAYQAIANQRQLMVVGAPGAGKSMLLRHIALSYAKGQLLNLPERPVVVFLELHRLNQVDSEEKLIHELVAAFDRDSFPKAERFVKQSLQRGTLMLLLDGLDEVNSDVRPIVVRQIRDLLDKYERCRAVISCRTAVYRDEFSSVMQQKLEVVEFTDQQIRRFLEAWKGEMPSGKSIEQLILTLRDRPRIMALGRNPLLLTIIAHLYTDPTFVLPHSRAEFYQKSTTILLEQWQSDFNKYRASDKQRILRHLALYNQDSSIQSQQDRRTLDYVAVLEQIRQQLPSLNLNPDSDTKLILDEIVERSGLFLRIDGGERYQFAHLTIQEYFAAVALKDDANELITRFRQNVDDWREVVKLWCGLAGNSTAFIQAVYEIDAITGFECLADAQEVDQGLADRILEEFKGRLGIPDQQDLIAAAFGAVAADDRPRGKAIFAFLKSILENSQEAYRRQAAANALSMTNLPQAAEVLASFYGVLEVVRAPLVRMGDLGVPVLKRLVFQEQTSAIALADLFKIGTPDAAIAFVELLWDDNLATAELSARYLAALLPQPGVEDALHECEPTPYRSEESLEWLWEPFNKRAGSNLGRIAGRVGYLLANSTAPIVNHSSDDFIPSLDPRLVVPVCAIYLVEQGGSHTLKKPWEFSQSQQQTIETLLEQDPQTPGLDSKTLEAIEELFRSGEYQIEPAPNHQNHPLSDYWKFLLSKLEPKVQLDLLNRLILYRLPRKDDWRNLFRVTKYDMRTGSHYRCVLLIAFGFSILSIVGIGFTIFNRLIFLSLAYPLIAIIVMFWSVCWLGLERSLEPDTFTKLGILGPFTFLSELSQLSQNRLVWSGIKIFREVKVNYFSLTGLLEVILASLLLLSSIISKDANTTLHLTLATMLFMSIFKTVSSKLTYSTGRIIGGTLCAIAILWIFRLSGLSIKVVGSNFSIELIDSDFSMKLIDPNFSIKIGVSLIIGNIIAGAMGTGIETWKRVELSSKERWLRYFTFLAFPWFCWFPIVGVFGTIGLHHLLKSAPFLTSLSISAWLLAAAIALFLFVVCVVLWRTAKQREERARNPLQGGILEAALRKGLRD